MTPPVGHVKIEFHQDHFLDRHRATVDLSQYKRLKFRARFHPKYTPRQLWFADFILRPQPFLDSVLVNHNIKRITPWNYADHMLITCYVIFDKEGQ